MIRSLVVPALCLALLVPAPLLAADGPGAEETFRRAHGELVALIDERAPDGKVWAQADALLDHHAMAVATLGGPSRYAERCGEHCAEYEGLLTQLVRHNVLKRLRERERGTMELLGATVGKTATKVDTRVSFVDAEGKRRSVKVSYVMHQVDEVWKVRDLRTDGVSLVGNIRHEVRGLYRDGGMEQVMQRLRSKVATLEG